MGLTPISGRTYPFTLYTTVRHVGNQQVRFFFTEIVMRPFDTTTRAEGRRISAVLLLVTALWGLNMTAMKTIASYFDPAVMATERAAVAAVFLGAMLWRQRATVQRTRMTRRQMVIVLACAALMVYFNQILLSAGLVRTTATNGSVAIALSPLVSSLMATLMLRC